MSAHPKWCSVRIRLTPDEVALLKAAEAVHGDALSREPHAVALRDALSLMKAGQKVAAARSGSAVILGEAEAAVLLAAVRYTGRQLDRYHDMVMGWRGHEGLDADTVARLELTFPETHRSAWEASRLARAFQALASRLEAPLSSRR